jgi:hypothetical protein
MKSIKEYFPRLLLAGGRAGDGGGRPRCLEKALPIVGGPVFANVCWAFYDTSRLGKPKAAGKGLGFALKKILQWSIVALGANRA